MGMTYRLVAEPREDVIGKGCTGYGEDRMILTSDLDNDDYIYCLIGAKWISPSVEYPQDKEVESALRKVGDTDEAIVTLEGIAAGIERLKKLNEDVARIPCIPCNCIECFDPEKYPNGFQGGTPEGIAQWLNEHKDIRHVSRDGEFVDVTYAKGEIFNNEKILRLVREVYGRRESHFRSPLDAYAVGPLPPRGWGAWDMIEELHQAYAFYKRCNDRYVMFLTRM